MNAAPRISDLSPLVTRWQKRALLAGAIATLLSLLGLFLDQPQFFHSYLFAWLFWSGLSFGTLVIVMLQNLTGGKWGAGVRSLSIAGFMTLPLMALLFLPIILGVHSIYPWSLSTFTETAGYHHKHQWFTLPFFIGRSVFYFAVLTLFAVLLRRRMRAANGRSLIALSAGGLIVYVLCMNFASVDWVMSLDPEWFSTIFVIIFMAGQFLSALALVTALLALCARQRSLGELLPDKVFHDLGNILLAFVVFWAYVSFSQFLIIWSGNLPKEISWYLERSRGGWQWFALALLLAQFAFPFALLLSRAAKRNRERLAPIALAIFAAGVLNNFWLVAPSFHPRGFFVHWLDLTEWLALGGFWFALFFHFLKQAPLLPRDLREDHE